MKIVIFGLTISSSWGNGHATLWRGLCKGLYRQKNQVVFFERDVPYYSSHRDLHSIPGGRLHFYDSWENTRELARLELADADAGIITSYCPEAIAASELLFSSNAFKVFYDLDTPVTLSEVNGGHPVNYLPPEGLAGFDLVLSYTGGAALQQLQSQLGARAVAPLYGSVDPEVHCPVPAIECYRNDLSYLGTYAEDRQRALEALFLEPARRLPQLRFVLGGAQYPQDFPWTDNIFFVRHLPPAEHPGFFSSSRMTLNVTRKAMAENGWCPSGRLFEAAACGTPLLSDPWPGLEDFFEPGGEILVAHDTEEALASLQLSDEELGRISTAAREKVLTQHTASKRAVELVQLLESGPAANHRPTEVSTEEVA